MLGFVVYHSCSKLLTLHPMCCFAIFKLWNSVFGTNYRVPSTENTAFDHNQETQWSIFKSDLL